MVKKRIGTKTMMKSEDLYVDVEENDEVLFHKEGDYFKSRLTRIYRDSFLSNEKVAVYTDIRNQISREYPPMENNND